MKENKGTNKFNIPQDYFEDFEDRLFLKISEDKLPKTHGFKVPETYFTEVDNKINKTIKESVVIKKPKVISLFTRKTILYAASIAACAVLFLSIFKTDENILSMNDIQVSEIESFIENGNISFDTFELTSMLDDDDELILENDLFSEETLEDYLLENINDTSLFLE